MNLEEFMAVIKRYLGEWLVKRFTGRIVFTINLRDGGIGSVNVTVDHQLQKR
jgi:hypothetical protein